MRAILSLLGLFLFLHVHAQDKYDYNWILGYGPSDTTLHYGGTLIGFQTDTPTLTYFETDLAFLWDNASISNESGQLIGYTNGCEIYNKVHELMDNGDNINEGPVHEQYCENVVGHYVNGQGALFLPVPGSDSLYALFHLRQLKGSIVKDFLYSTLDASANGGLGKVISKNLPIETDTFTEIF